MRMHVEFFFFSSETGETVRSLYNRKCVRMEEDEAGHWMSSEFVWKDIDSMAICWSCHCVQQSERVSVSE